MLGALFIVKILHVSNAKKKLILFITKIPTKKIVN